MPTKPYLDKAYSEYGANMGRGWDFAGQPGTADVVVKMYEAAPPATDSERRHYQHAKAFVYAQKYKPFVPGKCSLRKVRINSGGYDVGGAYWGLGPQLWYAGSDCGLIDLWFRAYDRGEAKNYVRERFANVRFWR